MRDRLNKDESSLGMRLIYGEESEGLWKQLDELDRLQQQYMPARDPSFSGSVKRGVGGAVEVLAQYVKGAYRGATTYGPAMAAAAGSTAIVMNAPAFTNPITAPAGLATTGSAMVAGFGTGMLLGAGMENFEREAGGAMVEYCRMKDNQGRPMDRNAARVAAVLTGVVNAGLEHFQMSKLLENIPGGDKLVKFFSRSGMKKLLSIPTVRSALAEIGKKYIGGIATESIQEMAQETATILGGELGKILSGQEFAGLDLEESIDRVLETGAQTVGTMAVSFLPGAAMNAVSGVRHAKVMQKGAEQTVVSLGISTDELMARVNAPDEPAQGRAVDGLWENPQPTGPAMKDGVQLGPTREAAAKLEAQTQEEESQTQPQAQGHAVDGLGENGAEEDTNVYLPAQAIESYNQENPGLLEDLGIVVEPVEGTSEVKLTAEQYEALEDVAPELVEAVKGDVRRGARGMTTKEVGETLKKKAEKPAWRTAEVDGITKELEQEALGAGLDKAEARQWSKMAGAFVGVTSKRYNIAPSELAKMKLERGKTEAQGESFGQPVNPGVNLEQKVPVLDLSSMEGTSTPKELLARLKDMALKDEVWISRDAEVFATLPRGKKLKHVAYSSRMPGSREARALRSNIASGLNDLVQNAVLVESVPNNDPKKADVLNFHRLYVPVRTDAGVQTVRIVAEELKGSDKLKPTDVELYDVVLEGQKESPAVSHGLLAKEVVPSPGAPFELTIADMLRGVKDTEGNPYVGEEYQQSSARQSEDYDPGDPKTWPAGAARDEALALEAWQNLENDDEPETWPESPEKTEALTLQKEYGEIEAWVESHSVEEVLANDELNERGVAIEKRLRDLRKELRKKKPKGAERRLLQLIEAEEEATAREAETYNQSAYHGSPHRGIEKMSLQHIGSGEGNQVYGYGIYSAGNRDVAQDYRVALGGASYTVGGRDINLLIEKAEQGRDYVMAEVLGEIAGSHKTIGELRQEYTKENGYDDAGDYQKALDKVERQGLKGDGQLYRLEVPENDVLLDWDAPFSKQPEKVKTAIREIAAKLTPEDIEQLGGNTDMLLFDEMTGQQLYAMLAWLPSVDSEKAASMLLLKHGIPGLRYLDGNSRNKGEGTHNFVIWDEDAMSIEETYYQRQAEETENIRSGQAAMEKVIAEHTDVMDAMHRSDLGSISFLWGEPGRGAKFKGGAGVSHIIAHRNAQGYDGTAVARKMVEVIAKGEIERRYGAEVPGGERANIVYDGYTAVLSLYKDGEHKTWLLTGWKDYGKETPGATSEGDGSAGATLQGPMRTRPEEGAGASDNSKPPLPQKGKSEPTSNGRLTVQPDGVSLIEFFKNANRSTSFHELAHHMFRVIYELSKRDGVDPQLIEDVNTILREAGVTREEFDSDNAEVRKAARTRVHEFFARGFEVYISEGRAPSKELRGVFRRLRAWMIEVYHDVVQALGIELSDEMRGVYDRLLAMPEEIDAETTIRELAVEEAALKEEIQRHEQEARERANEVKSAYREGVKAGREAEAERLAEFKKEAAERLAGFKDKAAAKLNRLKEEAAGKLDELEVKRRLQLGSERAKAQMRIAALKQKLQERQALKKEVNKLVKGINNMAKSESISWARHKELEKLLADYDLKKRRQEVLDRRAELEEYLKENPEAADTMNAADLEHLGTKTLNDMTLDDLRTLGEQVQQIYDRGKEEYKVWDLERTERRDTIHSELVAVLKKRKTNLPKIVTKSEDLKKQYKGVTGKLAKAKDWTYASTLGPDRFFDWLDKGATDYTGAFVRHLVDEVNKQRDAALRHIFERRKWMEDRLRPLGFRMSDFTRIAATIDGQDFTWDDIMEIYIGMRNDKKGRAILYGNLKNTSDPEGTAAYLIGLLSEDHKKAAELVVEDHNRNVDRIEAGLIDAFQKGMDRETDYTSIHRLEHLSSMGLIDAESAEALTDGMADAGVLRRVEDGFMKKRVEIKDENQTPVKLGLFSNWHEDVSRHEHAAAMATTARDIAGALLMRNPVDGQTIGRMVKERFGDEAWRTLVDFVNTNVTDDARLAHSLLDKMSNTLMKNMVIAYLAGNLGTALKQTTSIPRFLITAGPHRILVSIAQFLTQGPKFLENVYELDPQMRNRMGSPILTMLRQDPRWGKRMYQRGLDWMLAPIAMMDRWVAAIGWKATYDANLKRLGHEGAVREAQRAVRLTQQPASAKDAARMWRQNGFVRLAMVFTSDAAQTFGMTAYDLVQQLRSGKLGRTFSTLTALALTSILMKAASEGLPDDEDDEDEDRSWVLEAFTEQFISSIPLVGKEAMVLYDNLSGKRRGSQYSAFITPVEKVARAWRLWADEDSDEEEFRRATWLALEAFSLSGAAPIPVTGMRRMVQSMELAEEDGMAAALNMVGIRRRE